MTDTLPTKKPMDEKRLDEIREILAVPVNVLSDTGLERLSRAAIDLLASHDAQSTRIAELEGEVELHEKRETDCAAQLLKKIVQLSTLEQLARGVTGVGLDALTMDSGVYERKMVNVSDWNSLAALLAEKGSKG